MSIRTLRRQRLIRMGWLVKKHPFFRGMSLKGASRPYTLILHSDGTSADLTPVRRIDRRRGTPSRDWFSRMVP